MKNTLRKKDIMNINEKYFYDASRWMVENDSDLSDLNFEVSNNEKDDMPEETNSNEENNNVVPEDIDFISDFWNAGKANEMGFTEKDADPDQLAKGIEIEMEHTTNKEIAKIIALSHIAEFASYYDALEKMEEELKSENDKSSEENNEEETE
jgi:hypothetical protein